MGEKLPEEDSCTPATGLFDEAQQEVEVLMTPLYPAFVRLGFEKDPEEAERQDQLNREERKKKERLSRRTHRAVRLPPPDDKVASPPPLPPKQEDGESSSTTSTRRSSSSSSSLARRASGLLGRLVGDGSHRQHPPPRPTSFIKGLAPPPLPPGP